MSELIDLDIAINLNKNYYRRQGRKQEQERIIKLLEQVNEENTRPNLKPDSDLPTFNTRQLIALIKGEK